MEVLVLSPISRFLSFLRLLLLTFLTFSYFLSQKSQAWEAVVSKNSTAGIGENRCKVWAGVWDQVAAQNAWLRLADHCNSFNVGIIPNKWDTIYISDFCCPGNSLCRIQPLDGDKSLSIQAPFPHWLSFLLQCSLEEKQLLLLGIMANL